MSYLLYPWLPSSFTLQRTHQFNVQVVRSRSGLEMRRSLQSRPLVKYVLNYETLLEEERLRLLAFYYQHQGQMTPFWFHDWSERVLQGQLVGTANGQDVVYPLVRSYGLATDPFLQTEPVRNILPLLPFIGFGEGQYGDNGYGGTGWLDYPLDGYEPRAYIDGVEAEAQWELSDGQVMIRFEAPPPAGATITADFAQCRLVRFDTDLAHDLWTVRVHRANITLQEVIQ